MKSILRRQSYADEIQCRSAVPHRVSYCLFLIVVVVAANLRVTLAAPPDQEKRSAVESPVNKAASLGAIRGKVVDGVTGLPAANVKVTIEITKQTATGLSVDQRRPRSTETNAEGRYQFPELMPLEYNILASAPDRTCVALNSVKIPDGEPCDVADLKLIEGVILEGRVQTLKGQPFSREPKTDERLRVCVNGPSRPKSGTLYDSCDVDNEGRFRIRVPAGRTSLFLRQPSIWSRIWRRERFLRGIDVDEGNSNFVNMKVLDKATRVVEANAHERDPVHLPLPIDSERDAAETIRDLGGWYKLDADKHVIEVNMVYDDRTGTRYNNSLINTDEGMWIAPAFPRLKKLFLKIGQATDDSMVCLSELSGLQTIMIWDAKSLTDASAHHWANLVEVEYVHVSDGRIGNETLKELGKLPKVIQLSLQGNAFTNQGLAQLKDSHQIRSLWIGLSKNQYNDEGVAHLAGLKGLEELEIQNCEVTNEGLQKLAELKNLRSLYLGKSKTTAIGRANVHRERPELKIDGE